ncbi:MAG: hypothetical protein ACK5O9_04705 [Holosporales bacterium]
MKSNILLFNLDLRLQKNWVIGQIFVLYLTETIMNVKFWIAGLLLNTNDASAVAKFAATQKAEAERKIAEIQQQQQNEKFNHHRLRVAFARHQQELQRAMRLQNASSTMQLTAGSKEDLLTDNIKSQNCEIVALRHAQRRDRFFFGLFMVLIILGGVSLLNRQPQQTLQQPLQQLPTQPK